MIPLEIVTTTYKRVIGAICRNDLVSIQDPIDYILNMVQEYGIEDGDPQKLFLRIKGELHPFQLNLIESEDISIVYHNIVAPYGAYEYARFNGISFVFHTKESNHRFFPHVHAKYGNDEISIYLHDLRVVGKMSPNIKRTAVEYVKNHLDDFLKEWNNIINPT